MAMTEAHLDANDRICESPRAPGDSRVESIHIVAKEHRHYMLAIHFVLAVDMSFNICYDYGVDDRMSVWVAFVLQILIFGTLFSLFRNLFSLTFVYQAGLISIIL